MVSGGKVPGLVYGLIERSSPVVVAKIRKIRKKNLSVRPVGVADDATCCV